MSVKAMNQGLDGWLIKMSNVRSCLSWLVAHHECLRVDQTKRVNHYLAFHGLDGVHYYRDGTGCELFEGLLCVDVDRGEPAAESRMGMVPANNCFRSG